MLKRIALLSICLALPAFGLLAQDDLRWKSLRVKPKASEDLVDLRSPVITHEILVPADEPWTFGEDTFTFTIKRSGSVVAKRTAKEGEKEPKPETFSRPGFLEVNAFDLKYGVSVRADRNGTHVRIGSAYGTPIKVGRGVAWIVDSNLDGVLGNKGDGVVVKDSKTVGPFDGNGQIWDENGAIAVRRNDDGTWEQAKLSPPRKGDSDHAAAWYHVNWRRQQAGVLPLEYDHELEKGMIRHGEYYGATGETGHSENSSSPHFTKEGHQAAQECVLGYKKKSHLVGVKEQLATLFHRSQVLDPSLSKSAVVVHKGCFMMNTLHHRDSPIASKPLIYPAHGMVDVDVNFHTGGENPKPLEVNSGFLYILGTCIAYKSTKYSYGGKLGSDPTLEVFVARGKSEKTLGTGVLHWPGNPSPSFGRGDHFYGHIAYLPKKHLPPNATIRSVLRFKEGDGEFFYDWDFHTGKAYEMPKGVPGGGKR